MKFLRIFIELFMKYAKKFLLSNFPTSLRFKNKLLLYKKTQFFQSKFPWKFLYNFWRSTTLTPYSGALVRADPSREFGFTITVTGGRTYNLCADTKQDMDDWITALTERVSVRQTTTLSTTILWGIFLNLFLIFLLVFFLLSFCQFFVIWIKNSKN